MGRSNGHAVLKSCFCVHGGVGLSNMLWGMWACITRLASACMEGQDCRTMLWGLWACITRLASACMEGQDCRTMLWGLWACITRAVFGVSE